MGNRISRAEEIRHDSDYDEFYIASKDETEKQIACAAELVRMVEARLTEDFLQKTPALLQRRPNFSRQILPYKRLRYRARLPRISETCLFPCF